MNAETNKALELEQTPEPTAAPVTTVPTTADPEPGSYEGRRRMLDEIGRVETLAREKREREAAAAAEKAAGRQAALPERARKFQQLIADVELARKRLQELVNASGGGHVAITRPLYWSAYCDEELAECVVERDDLRDDDRIREAFGRNGVQLSRGFQYRREDGCCRVIDAENGRQYTIRESRKSGLFVESSAL